MTLVFYCASLSLMNGYNTLIVDNDAQTREHLSDILSSRTLKVEGASNSQDPRLAEKNFQLALINFDEAHALQSFKILRDSGCLIIIYADKSSVQVAVDAMKMGAFDYIEKPFTPETITAAANEAIEYLNVQTSRDEQKEELKQLYTFDNIVGSSSKMKRVFDLISRVASSDSTILILGESGTGKELVARATHFNSGRADGPFVPVNCGAIPEELLESELFGHEKGAFTGAFRTRIGRFELAGGGSIFLDEIGEMSPTLQVKLLRVIQEKEFERVGGVSSIKADVRIIAATNKNLEEEVAAGRFREDLYYRLNVIPIDLPPLRERTGDVTLLAQHFLQSRSGSITDFSEQCLGALNSYQWPGNVRELENLIERLSVLCDGPVVELRDLPDKISCHTYEAPSAVPRLELPDDGIDLSIAVSEFERDIIVQALNKTNWVKNRAAQLLKVNRTTLVEKIKKQNLQKPEATVN